MRHIHRIALCLCLGACTQPPDVPDPGTDDLRDAAFPGFVPLGDVTVAPPPPETTAQNVAARVARLRARAAELKGVEFD